MLINRVKNNKSVTFVTLFFSVFSYNGHKKGVVMDKYTIGFWVIGLIVFGLAIKKDKEKAKATMKKTKGMMKHMIGDILGIILLIGLVLTFVPPSTIENVLGSNNTIVATVVASLIGSITLIPAFVAFPLVGSFIDAGASVVPGVSFLTTLTMVGVVTFSLEKKTFGTSFAIKRNIYGFVGAIVIALVMGVII